VRIASSLIAIFIKINFNAIFNCDLKQGLGLRALKMILTKWTRFTPCTDANGSNCEGSLVDSS